MKLIDVYIYTNGMVIAFNAEGKQIPECQGFILEDQVIKNLKKYANEDTHFFLAKWQKQQMKCDFSWWFKKRKEAKNEAKNKSGKGKF